uniref:Glyoxalase domain containing 4 n=1 Tax=Salmo trutta TaxID=8032 RepID=A0A674DT72_SALTR
MSCFSAFSSVFPFSFLYGNQLKGSLLNVDKLSVIHNRIVHNKLTWIVVALIRALHFIFKAGDRSKTATFNRDVLGMTNLRYKEFEEGCKATCKGPYDGKWSKTTVGFGPEVDDFVAELFYGYGVGEFRLGNDFLGLTLQSSQAVNNANWLGWPLTEVGKGLYLVEASGGYHFYLVDKDQPPNDPVQNVSLAWSDLQESIHCCSSLLGMKVKENNEEKKTVLMGFTDTHCKLELHNIVGTVDHGTAFGRIAFSCPREQFSDLEALMTKGKHQIFTILVSLDTSGKATVEVVIRADSDAHEICFVFLSFSSSPPPIFLSLHGWVWRDNRRTCSVTSRGLKIQNHIAKLSLI